MTLRQLKPNRPATVLAVTSPGGELHDGFKTRLEALGLIPNKPVRVLRQAFFGGPMHVRVGSTTEIAIRRSEAQLVQIERMPREDWQAQSSPPVKTRRQQAAEAEALLNDGSPTLRELRNRTKAAVREVVSPGGELHDGFKTRLEALGLIPNKPVQVLRRAFFGGPMHVRVGSTTEIAIRRSEARLVRINPDASPPEPGVEAASQPATTEHRQESQP
jgi:ferrous iron transport protein A